MSFWWELLWQDENFRMKASQRYSELRSSIFSEQHIFEIIDDAVTYLGAAINRNFSRWPILGNYIWPNYHVFDTYEEEVLYLKSWTTQRLAWMDSEILQLEVEESFSPSKYTLNQAYPNPFNPITKIDYSLPKEGNVSLVIFDISGREVVTLVDGLQEPGHRSTTWNGTDAFGRNVSAGMYLYLLKAGDFVDTKKMILLK